MTFARHVFRTYALRIALIPLGIAQAMILARHLGPAGQGVFAAISTWIGMAAMIAGLGLGTAATAFAATDPARLPSLAGNALATAVVLGGAAIAGLFAIHRALPGVMGDVPLWPLLLAALALPFSLAAMQLQALLLGRERVGSYNVLDVTERVALFAGVAVLMLWLRLGLVPLLALTVAVAVLRFVVARVLLGHGAARPDAALLRRMLPLGLKAYAAVLLSWLVLRSDLALVNALLGPRDTGCYSIAVQLTDLLLLLPTTAGTLLFPRIALTGDADSAAFTARICRLTALFSFVACVACALCGRELITLLFGSAFAAAAPALLLLLPGVWCLAIEGLLANDLAGRDYPPAIVGAWIVCLALNLGLNLWWIPRFGIAGASAASSVAYAAALVFIATLWLRRFPALGIADLVWPRADDIRHLLLRVRGFARAPS